MCKDPRRRKISRYLRVLQGSKRKCGVHMLARSTTWRRRGPWTRGPLVHGGPGPKRSGPSAQG
jgi:hypothetical protein